VQLNFNHKKIIIIIIIIKINHIDKFFKNCFSLVFDCKKKEEPKSVNLLPFKSFMSTNFSNIKVFSLIFRLLIVD